MSESQPGGAVSKVKAEQLFRQSPLDKSIKVESSINTGYLGQCSVLKDTRTQKVLLLKEVVYNTEEEFVLGVLNTQRKKALRNEGLLYVIDYSAEKISNFCSSFYKVKVYLLPHLQELRKTVKDRQNSGLGFKEEEMTYMLYHTVNGLAELHKAGFTHKQISPETVDTTNLVGRNPKLIHFEEDLNAKVRQVAYNNIFKSKELYLAPEIFQRTSELTKAKVSLQFDEHKLDAFSLGMTLLYAGVSKPVQDCYDTKKYQFNENNLRTHLNEFRTKYVKNPLLTDALDRLLDLDVEKRASPLALQAEMPGLEEINYYFEVSGGESEDYNLIYPLSQEDQKAYQFATNYFQSSGRLFTPPSQPQNYLPGYAGGVQTNTQGTAGASGNPQGNFQGNQQGSFQSSSQTGGLSQNQWTSSQGNLGPNPALGGQTTTTTNQWSAQGAATQGMAGGAATQGNTSQWSSSQAGAGMAGQSGPNAGFNNQWSGSQAPLPQTNQSQQNAQGAAAPGPSGSFKPGPQGGAIPGVPSGFDTASANSWNSQQQHLGGWAQQGTTAQAPPTWNPNSAPQAWGYSQNQMQTHGPSAPQPQQAPQTQTPVAPQGTSAQPPAPHPSAAPAQPPQQQASAQGQFGGQNQWAPPAGPSPQSQDNWAQQGTILDSFKYGGPQKPFQQPPAAPAQQPKTEPSNAWQPPPASTPGVTSGQSWASQGWHQQSDVAVKPKAIHHIANQPDPSPSQGYATNLAEPISQYSQQLTQQQPQQPQQPQPQGVPSFEESFKQAKSQGFPGSAQDYQVHYQQQYPSVAATTQDIQRRNIGPVMASHTIFAKPPQIQQPAPQPQQPPQSFLSQTEYLKRSASQPSRIGQDQPSQYYTPPAAPEQAGNPHASGYSRPLSVSHTTSNASLPTTSFGNNILPPRGPSVSGQMVVTQVTGVDQSPLGINPSDSNRRIRSSSHNIIRNGVVVAVNNPTEELRASRIVISKDKVDFFIDDKPAGQPQTTVIPAATVVTGAPVVSSTQQQTITSTSYQSPMVTSTPLQIYSPPVQVSSSPFGNPTYIRAPSASYTSGTVLTPMPQIVTGTPFVNSGVPAGTRLYPGSPVTRIAGVTHYQTGTRVGAPVQISSGMVGGLPSSYLAGTPKRIVGGQIVSGGVASYGSSSNPFANYAGSYQSSSPSGTNIRRGYDTRSPQKSSIIENKVIYGPVGGRKREDSDIKPRELDIEDPQTIADPVWNE